jgi:hypothetical protein
MFLICCSQFQAFSVIIQGDSEISLEKKYGVSLTQKNSA